MTQFQSFGEVFAAVKRRFWLMLLIVILGCIASVYVALQQEKEYEAIAAIQIEASQVTETLGGAAVRTDDAQQRVKLVEQRIMSRDNLIQIVDKYGLFNEEPMSVIERVGLMRGAIRLEQVTTTAESWMPGGTVSGLLIYVRLNDPDQARDVANELMYGVIDAARSRSVAQAEGALALFVEEETRVSAEIDALESQVADFKQANSQYLPAGLTLLNTELGELREAALNIDQQVVALESNSTRQRSGVVEQQVGLLLDQKRVIEDRITTIEAAIAAAPAIERDLNLLERELTRKKDQYSVVTRRKAEAEIGQLLEERQQGGRFEVLETALTPDYPVSRSRKSIAILGAFASGLFALGVGFAIELMRPAIRSPAQMERALGIQPVVAIPVVATRRERQRRNLTIGGGAAAAAVSLPVMAWLFSDRLGFLSKLGRK